KTNNLFSPFFRISFFLFLLSIFWVEVAPAQAPPQDRYVIFLSDKDGTAYALDRPLEYLSSAALERRELQGITLDSSDLPVNADYVAQLAEAGAEVYYTSRWLNAVMVDGDQDADAYRALNFVDRVELIKPTRSEGGRKKQGSSYDRKLPAADHENAEAQLLNMLQNEMLGIDAMHQAGYTGKGVSVAVFDGGFKGVDTVAYFRHLYKNGQMIPGYDFVGNSPDVYRYGQHGTEALSCIAAYQPGVLEAGAYEANIMLCITEESGSEYRVEEYNWLFAAELADSAGIDIISTSLGYTTFDDPAMNYEYEDLDGNTAVITRAVNLAAQKGILCVISAGNEGSGRWRYVSPPADAIDVLSVGAVSSSGDRVSFSSFGPTADGRVKPDVSALGLQTVVVNARGEVVRSNGTSFSAPLITGLTAGVWEAFPGETNLEIIERIRLAGNSSLAPNNELGYGIPTFSAALLVPVPGEEEIREANYRVYPNPIESGKLFVEAKTRDLSFPVDVRIYNSTGQLVTQTRFTSDTFSPTLSLDTSGLGRGVYILHILSPTASDTMKVIKF
ncbi:MAG: S8 family serine peptidase, partial [Tunicatimonas sp.]